MFILIFIYILINRLIRNNNSQVKRLQMDSKHTIFISSFIQSQCLLCFRLSNEVTWKVLLVKMWIIMDPMGKYICKSDLQLVELYEKD